MSESSGSSVPAWVVISYLIQVKKARVLLRILEIFEYRSMNNEQIQWIIGLSPHDSTVSLQSAV